MCSFTPAVAGEGRVRGRRAVGKALRAGGLDPRRVLNSLPPGWALNCGGRGGKPGPCPTGRKKKPAPGFAPLEEHAAARRQALAKVRNAPVPTREQVAKARKDLAEAARAGGESRGGSAEDRRRQRLSLFMEFGGGERGYVVCPWTGLKMHWTDDKERNPRGYPLFERGKVFLKCQGGGYQLANLVQESFTANRSRNDKPIRKENLDGCRKG